MDTSKYSRSRGHTMGSNKRVPPYLVLVLLVIGAAALSVGILYKMRERGVLTVLLQERDQQLISLQVLLEKEKEVNKEIRRKVDELEAKTSILSIERAELKNKLMDSETTTTYLTNTQKELDAALMEKESYINQMKENAAASTLEQTTSIKELLQQKEAERTETSSNSIPATEENFNIATASESRHQDESIVIGANNENAASDTMVLDKSENSNDSVPTPAEEQSSDNTSTSESNNQDSIPTPAAEQNSDKTTASESRHQDESIVVGANNENATSDTVMLDKSENFNDSVPTPAEEQNSNNTSASESSNQDYKPTPAAEQNSDKTTDESTVGGANNDHAANETEVPDKYANSTDSIPAPAEEQHSYNATALESNQKENSSTEEQFLRLTTNIEDGQLQENKVDGNEHSDDAPEGSHSSDKSEVPQLSQNLAGNQEGGKEQPDGTRQTEDPQSEVSSHSKDSKLLEMEDGIAVVKEPEKEVNPEGKPEISEDRLSESNQNIAQAVETVAVPTDANSSMSTNSDERKKTSKRHRRRFRSRSKKRTTVAVSNNDGSHQMEVVAAGNT